MNFPRPKRRRSGDPTANLRGLRPSIEAFERRELMASNFLQGFATIGTAPLPGATVTLYSLPGAVQVGAAQVTGADGGYLFTGLAKGQYRLVETPPAGDANSSTQATTQLDQVTASTSSSIDVTLNDPSTTPSWVVNTAGSNKEPIYFTASNPKVNTANHGSEVGSLAVNVVETDAPYTTPTFSTFCVDLNRDIYPNPYSGGNQNTNLPYTIAPLDAKLAATAGTSAASAGRIAYLFDHHGQDSLTASQSAGLQLAVWELEYDPSPTDVTAGSFQVASGTDPAAIAAANGYLAESAGKGEKAVYLDGLALTGQPTGSQGLLATGSFNFANAPIPATGTIAGLVYADNADSGTYDSSKDLTTIPGVTVTLTGTVNGSAIAPITTTSGAGGAYSFTKLPAGTYTVTEGTAPTPYLASKSNAGSISGIALPAGGTSGSNNFGEILPDSLSGFVYADANTNGGRDAGEPGVATTLTLTGTNDLGQAIAPITTTSVVTGNPSTTGGYSFTGLRPGTYTVTATQPAGYVQGTNTPGSIQVGTTLSPSVGTPTANDGIAAIALTAPGAVGSNYNFGELGTSISGTVYNDIIGNGLTAANAPRPGDTPEAGVTVKLYNTSLSSTPIATAVTGPNGTYSFTGLPTGTYAVAETIPPGHFQTGPNSVSYVLTTSAATPNLTNENFANYTACSTAGLANVKYFVNGVQVPTLSGHGVQGAVVTVTFDDNAPAGSAPLMLSLASYEAAFPYFTIDNVSQQVLVGQASGTFAPGSKNDSLTVTLPNSYFQVDFVCGAVIPQFGPGGSNVDYGEEGRFINGDIGGTNPYSPSTLSGTVYADANGNKTFGPGDVGLTGIPLTLTGTTGIGTPVSLATSTGAGGAYSFAGLAPGTYTVTEAQPSGFVAETSNPGLGGGIAAVGSIGSISLNSNTADTGNNFGEIGTSISGTVYNDATGNGLTAANAPMPGDTPEAGVTVKLLGPNSVVVATATTAADGTYSIAGVPFGTYTVVESVPAGHYQTGPTLLTYPITTSAGSPSSANDNFSNYAACSTAGLANVKYFVNGKQVSDLRGNASQGACVTVTFTVAPGASPIMLSLSAYEAPAPYYTPTNVVQQVLTSAQTGTFGPGCYSLTVTLPRSYYQVDFACGAVINQFGPAGSNIDYGGQGRLLSADNGGTCLVAACPPPLAISQGDVGNVGTNGTTTYSNGTYTLTGSGSDIWNQADAFNYDYQTLNGDGEIVARVASISDTDSWAKAGVMIRQSLDPGSAQASVFATPGNGVVFQDRNAQGANSNNWSAGSSYGCNASTPVYVKLVRSGGTISGYDSPNGLNWQFIGSDTINLSQQVYIGLAVTSHNNGAVATARFDSVSTTGYWASSAGQSLIQSFGGWTGSTSLSGFLAQAYPNLYGCNAGLNNLTGQNNNGVASFAQALEAQYGPESLECLTLATALDEYATSSLLGGQVAHNWGFNTSWYGLAGQSEDTTGACDAFGTSCNNTSTSVWNMLQAENNQAVGGVLYAGNAARHQQAGWLLFQVTASCC